MWCDHRHRWSYRLSRRKTRESWRSVISRIPMLHVNRGLPPACFWSSGPRDLVRQTTSQTTNRPSAGQVFISTVLFRAHILAATERLQLQPHRFSYSFFLADPPLSFFTRGPPRTRTQRPLSPGMRARPHFPYSRRLGAVLARMHAFFLYPPYYTTSTSTSGTVPTRNCAWGGRSRSHITAHSTFEASRRSTRADECRRVTVTLSENVGILSTLNT